MAVTLNTTPFETRFVFSLEDARGQIQRGRLLIDPAATDTQVAAFVAAIDGGSNGLLTASVERIYGAVGMKSAAVDAPEANISEMMEIIMAGIDPVTARKASRTLRLGAMTRSDENYPAGTLKATDANIAAIITFLNAHYAFQAPDNSIHIGLLAVDTGASHHITVEDIVDIT